MRKGILVLSIFLLLAAPSRAMPPSTDFTAGFLFRSFPLGALLTAKVAENFLLWGERNSPQDWKYGYLRPSLFVGSIAVFNQVIAQLDFYPISIFGLSFGYDWGVRGQDNASFDCSTVECRGSLGRTFGEARLLLGAGDFFMIAEARIESLIPSRTNQPFADQWSILVGATGGDTLAVINLAPGWKWNEQWSTGLFINHARMQLQNGVRNFDTAYVAYRQEAWTFRLGAGVFSSNAAGSGFTSFLTAGWALGNSLSFLR